MKFQVLPLKFPVVSMIKTGLLLACVSWLCHLNVTRSPVILQLGFAKKQFQVVSAIALDVNTVDNPEWIRTDVGFPCRYVTSSAPFILDRCIDSLT